MENSMIDDIRMLPSSIRSGDQKMIILMDHSLMISSALFSGLTSAESRHRYRCTQLEAEWENL